LLIGDRALGIPGLQNNSLTNQLAIEQVVDQSTRRLDNLWTNQLVEMFDEKME